LLDLSFKQYRKAAFHEFSFHKISLLKRELGETGLFGLVALLRKTNRVSPKNKQNDA